MATAAPLAATTTAAAASLLARGARLGWVVRIQGLRGGPGGHAAWAAIMLLHVAGSGSHGHNPPQ